MKLKVDFLYFAILLFLTGCANRVTREAPQALEPGFREDFRSSKYQTDLTCEGESVLEGRGFSDGEKILDSMAVARKLELHSFDLSIIYKEVHGQIRSRWSGRFWEEVDEQNRTRQAKNHFTRSCFSKNGFVSTGGGFFTSAIEIPTLIHLPSQRLTVFDEFSGWTDNAQFNIPLLSEVQVSPEQIRFIPVSQQIEGPPYTARLYWRDWVRSQSLAEIRTRSTNEFPLLMYLKKQNSLYEIECLTRYQRVE